MPRKSLDIKAFSSHTQPASNRSKEQQEQENNVAGEGAAVGSRPKTGSRSEKVSRSEKRSRWKSTRVAGSLGSGVSSSGETGTSLGASSLDEDATWTQRLRHKDRLLTFLIFSGVFIGIVLGSVVKATTVLCYWNPRRTMYVNFVGHLFTRMLNGLRTPITVSAIVAAIGSVDLPLLRSIAWRFAIFWVLLSLLACSVGALTTLTLQPLLKAEKTACETKSELCNVSTGATCPFWNRGGSKSYAHDCTLRIDAFLDFFRNLLPENPVQGFIEKVVKALLEITSVDLKSPAFGIAPSFSKCADYIAAVAASQPRGNLMLSEYDVKHEWKKEANTLGLYMLAVASGVCALLIGEPARPFINIFISFSEVTLLMGNWALWLTPIAVVSIVAGKLLGNPHLGSFLPSIKLFMVVYCLSCVLFSFVVLPGIYFLTLRKNPLKFFLSILPAISSTFGTSSSYASIPLTMKCLEKHAGLDPRVVRLLIPIATTIDLPGSMIFIASSTCFLILRQDGEMSLSAVVLLILVTGPVAVMTTSFVGVSSLLKTQLVLSMLDYPAHLANDLLLVTWLFRHFFIVPNMVGDCVIVAAVNKYCHKSLQIYEEREEKNIQQDERAEATETRK